MDNRIFARLASKGNIKLGASMGTFSKLYSDREFNTQYGTVKGTCGGHCEGCRNACYVAKSYRYGSVINGHARNTLAFRSDLEGSFEAIDRQLTRKRKPFYEPIKYLGHPVERNSKKVIDETSHNSTKDVLNMVGETINNEWRRFNAEGRA